MSNASARAVEVAVRSQLVRTDVPVMVALSVLMLLLALDGSVGRLEGGVLLLLLVAYVALTVRRGRRAGVEPAPGCWSPPPRRSPPRSVSATW